MLFGERSSVLIGNTEVICVPGLPTAQAKLCVETRRCTHSFNSLKSPLARNNISACLHYATADRSRFKSGAV